jgi:hypothetical protein
MLFAIMDTSIGKKELRRTWATLQETITISEGSVSWAG